MKAPRERPNESPKSHRIFLVHGRDETVRRALVTFLKSLGKEPVVLAEQASGGLTVIEKFERYAAGVDYAVVLLTPDDVGGLRNDRSKQRVRARQNVLFELGYFVAKLGRGRVCVMATSDVEIPSDLQGIVYVSLDNLDEWSWALVREFLEAGISFDAKTMSHACEDLFRLSQKLRRKPSP